MRDVNVGGEGGRQKMRMLTEQWIAEHWETGLIKGNILQGQR